MGVAPVLCTKENPLEFVPRKVMFEDAFEKMFPNITVAALPDMEEDVDWSNEVDKRVRENYPIGTVVLYGSRKSFIKHYSGHFETKELPPYPSPSGTEVREIIRKEVLPDRGFRAGNIYAASNQYPKVFPTVDVAVVRNGEILLGRKHGAKRFRFIGGFTDPSDDSYEDAAIREGKEESGLRLRNPQYICSQKMDDWRYRSEEDKIITHLFICEEFDGTANAGDDIEEVKWFAIESLDKSQISKVHHELLDKFLKYYSTKIATTC